ncbi:MAG: helix-turn-helix domain-containing protein [Bacteroidetes bacterium]|nr:helix-turn-helix domain-containing protein [Bacteroidota bacterium]
MEKNLQKLSANIEQLLQKEETPLTFLEAAEYCNFSKSYMYKLTSLQKIAHYKPNGKKIYFLKSDLRTWLLRNRQSTADEIERKATNYIVLKKAKV